MVNEWALLLPVLLLSIVVYRWSTRPTPTVYVAHTLPGRLLPRYRARLRRLRIAAVLTALSVGVLSVSAAVLVARPHGVEVRDEGLASRDNVLCLDVSGSVLGFDVDVMEAFAGMVDSFQGERVALVIWNSNSRVVLPLTNDYPLIEETLREGARALEADPYTDYPKDPELYLDFTAGTYLESTGGASLVGDGLVNCALQFDSPERSRSIILATDNDVSTPEAQVYSLREAVEFAKERTITIHGLYIETYYGTDNYQAREMVDLIEGAGGYVAQAGDDAAGQLLAEIEAQQAADLGTDPVTTIIDRPGPWPFLAAASIALLVGLGWRYRL